LLTLLQRKKKRKLSMSMIQTVLTLRASSMLGGFENLHELNEIRRQRLLVKRNVKRLSDGGPCQRSNG
jgi:hypothetical protein